MNLTDYEWLNKSRLSEYAGKWVAVLNKKVIASDENMRNVVNKVEAMHPKGEPVYTRVSEWEYQIV